MPMRARMLNGGKRALEDNKVRVSQKGRGRTYKTRNVGRTAQVCEPAKNCAQGRDRTPREGNPARHPSHANDAACTSLSSGRPLRPGTA